MSIIVLLVYQLFYQQLVRVDHDHHFSRSQSAPEASDEEPVDDSRRREAAAAGGQPAGRLSSQGEFPIHWPCAVACTENRHDVRLDVGLEGVGKQTRPALHRVSTTLTGSSLHLAAS